MIHSQSYIELISVFAIGRYLMKWTVAKRQKADPASITTDALVNP